MVRERGFDWALCLDGDGQHAGGDVPRLLECAERTGAAMVIGNRMDQPSQMPWLRCRVNRWMSRRLSTLAGATLPDTQCGFRLINLGEWVPGDTRCSHFEIESELLLSYLQRGRRVEFVPVAVIYTAGSSKIHPVRDTFRWFRWWAATAPKYRAGRRNT
jgi:hypothetical protein